MKTIEFFDPTPKQLEASSIHKRNILFGGAMGGGKTAWECGHIIHRMVIYPGNRGFIGRKNFSDFKISTYLVLQKTLRPFFEANIVEENKGDKVFRFWNGSELYYGAIEPDQGEDVKKNPLFSAEFGIIAIDEAWEISFDQFKKISTRLRHTLPKTAKNWHAKNKMGKKCPFYQIIMASNPAQNWLKDYFLLAPNPETDAFVQSLPKENPHNPDDYEEQIRSTFRGDEKFIKAYLEGSWDHVGAVDDLLTMEDVRQAFHKDPATGRTINPCLRPYEHRVISCDPAYFGDDKTVIYGWENEFAKECLSYGKQDPMYTVGMILDLEARMKANCAYGVDDTGGYGSGIVSSLKQRYNEDYTEHKRVIPVNFASKEGVEPCFFNMRAKLYWEAAEMIKARKCSIPELDIELHGELCAIKYSRRGGQIFIEEKDKIKKRLGKSPDRADAFVIGLFVNRMLTSSKIKVAAPWEEQKPMWQVKREEEMERRHYEDHSDDASAKWSFNIQ